jgi:RNA polymerase sigma factor for flagellar operon FliA
MGLTIAELDSLQHDITRASVLSLHGFAPETGAELLADHSAGPEGLLLQRERLGYLHDAIGALPARLLFVVTAYFFEQRQMNDIAAELGVTESRVSQLRAEALHMLRDGMNAQLDPSMLDTSAKPMGRVAATRTAYYSAIAERNTLAGRLAMSTPRGDIRPDVGARYARTA